MSVTDKTLEQAHKELTEANEAFAQTNVQYKKTE